MYFGLAFSTMSLFNFLFSLYWSKKIKKNSANILFMIGCFGYGLGQFFFLFAQNPFQLLMSRMISGTFVSALMVGVPYYFTRIATQEERSVHITKLATFFSVGGTIGYFVGGFLGDYNIFLPIVLQVTLYVLAGFIYFLSVDIPIDTSIQTQHKMKYIPLHKQQIIYLILIFCLLVASTSLTQMFAYYLINNLQLSSGMNGITKAIVGVLSLLCNFTITLRIQFSKKPVFWIKVYISVLCLFYALFVATITMKIFFLVFGILIMVIDTMHLPIIQNACLKHSEPHQQSEILGFINSSRCIGQIIGATIGSFVYQYQATYPFVFSMCFVFIGFIALLQLKQD